MTDTAATALLTEHFRYTPLTLLDDIINTVNELVFRAVNAIEEGLTSTPAESLGFRPDTNTAVAKLSPDQLQQAKQDEIDIGIIQLESLLHATVDRDFDKFEIYTLRNILAVGHAEEGLEKWVRLEHYKAVDEDTDETLTPEAVQLQRRKVHESEKLNALLVAEETRNAAVLERLRGLRSSSALLQAPRTEQNTLFAVSQLPALRSHLRALKTDLAQPYRASRTADETAREAYIGSQARAALARSGVDEIGSNAKRVGKDEVEGIEAIARELQ